MVLCQGFELIEGKAITSLQFISEPSKIMKSQEAILECTEGSLIIYPSYLLWENRKYISCTQYISFEKNIFQEFYKPIFFSYF